MAQNNNLNLIQNTVNLQLWQQHEAEINIIFLKHQNNDAPHDQSRHQDTDLQRYSEIFCALIKTKKGNGVKRSGVIKGKDKASDLNEGSLSS